MNNSTKKEIALLGNPNCGKTTLFNLLTGLNQKVGNWTGVTVDEKISPYLKDKSILICDLPGVYSLKPNSLDEKVVSDYFKSTPPDVIINVVDGTCLERNLYLTVCATTLNLPMIVAVNMADQLEKNGVKVDYARLSKLFGVPFLPISALKNTNVDTLIDLAKKGVKSPVNLLEKNETFYDKDIYSFITKTLSQCTCLTKTRAEKITQKIDNVITHKVFGLPIFFAVLTLIYFISSMVGGFFSEQTSAFCNGLNAMLSNAMLTSGVSNWLVGLICGACLKGIISVICFLPQIVILFALMGILEYSGYMARVCFITDRLLCKLGLGGKSLIPLALSCGCSVTGLMATRTIEDNMERQVTIFVAPFMPCGAKMAVFSFISQTFFNGNALICASLYFLSIFVVALTSKLINLFNVKSGRSKDKTFILEMPVLRVPSLRSILSVILQKSKEFLIKAGTVIFAVSIVIWLLTNFGISGYVGLNIQNSFIYLIGNSIKYLFVPLGFGKWQPSVAVLMGLLAKEAVVETLSLTALDILSLFDSGFSAYAFMVFILLSAPCVSAIAQAKRELASSKKLFVMLLFEFIVAYIMALIINTFGMIYIAHKNLIFCLSACIIIIVLTVKAFKSVVNFKCMSCANCSRGDKKCRNSKRNTTI